MTRLRVFLCRLSGLVRKGSLERDMDEEVDYALPAIHPGFSMLVGVCLTLGIGANASVFSWIGGILLSW